MTELHGRGLADRRYSVALLGSGAARMIGRLMTPEDAGEPGVFRQWRCVSAVDLVRAISQSALAANSSGVGISMGPVAGCVIRSELPNGSRRPQSMP